MTALSVRLPASHDAQRLVLNEAKRFNVVCCGRRWGKTEMGAGRVIGPALEGYPTGWFVPVSKDADEVWRYIKRVLLEVTVDKSEISRRLGLVTGGSVELWTMQDPDSGRGRKYKTVVLDEAAKVSKLKQAWTETIRPTLTDDIGDAWFLSTPKGRNYFFSLFNMAATYPDDWASWQMPTVSNPYIDPAEVADAKRHLPQSAFAQEYLAEFTDDAGIVFRNVRACVDKRLNNATHDGAIHYGGLDWAQLNDFTAIVIINNRGEVVSLDRFNQIGWEVQYDRVRTATRKWKLTGGYAETNSIGSPNLEQLQKTLKQWFGFETTNASKNEIIQALILAFEKKKIAIPDDPVLIAELESFEANRLPSGRWRYSAPDGMHDDTVIALALGWWAYINQLAQIKAGSFKY